MRVLSPRKQGYLVSLEDTVVIKNMLTADRRRHTEDYIAQRQCS